MRLIETEYIVKHYMGQHHILDLCLKDWYKFIYLFIPNNWLRMHGYPLRKRKKRCLLKQNGIPQEQRYSCDLDGDRWEPDSFCSFAERRTDGEQSD